MIWMGVGSVGFSGYRKRGLDPQRQAKKILKPCTWCEVLNIQLLLFKMNYADLVASSSLPLQLSLQVQLLTTVYRKGFARGHLAREFECSG